MPAPYKSLRTRVTATGRLLSLLISLGVIVAGTSAAQERDSRKYDPRGFLPGRLVFWDEQGVIKFPKDVRKIFLTAGDSNYAHSNLHLGDGLYVDSVMSNGDIEVMTDSSQVMGIEIGSTALRRLMVQYRVSFLYRRSPLSAGADSLRQNPVTKEWYKPKDLSRWYTIGFPDSVSVDSLIGLLRQIPGLENVQRYPKVSSGTDPAEVLPFNHSDSLNLR